MEWRPFAKTQLREAGNVRNRYLVLGLSAFLALALAVPALGGPSNPIADGAASAKKTAQKALKKAKKANKAAKAAQSSADAAQLSADGAQSTADGAQTAAEAAQTSADAAQASADAAQSTADSKYGTVTNVEGTTSPTNNANKSTVFASCPSGRDLIGRRVHRQRRRQRGCDGRFQLGLPRRLGSDCRRSGHQRRHLGRDADRALHRPVAAGAEPIMPRQGPPRGRPLDRAVMSAAVGPDRGREGGRRWWLVPVLIALAAVAIRLIVIVADSGYEPINDAFDYDRHAASIAAGDGYPGSEYGSGIGPTALRSPGYPLALAVVYAVSDDSVDAGRVAGALLGGLTVLLVFLLAAPVWGRGVGLLAASITAVFPPLVLLSTELFNETLFIPLTLAAVLCATRYRESGLLRWAVLTGASGRGGAAHPQRRAGAVGAAAGRRLAHRPTERPAAGRAGRDAWPRWSC